MNSATKLRSTSMVGNILGNLTSEDTAQTIASVENPTADNSFIELPIAEIWRPKQQRLFFDPQEIEKLKTAIQEEGFRGAVLVTPLPPKSEALSQGFKYELVFGASRVNACEELDHEIIRAEIQELTPQQVRRIRFDENMVRNNLNAFEVLLGYLELMADEADVTPDVVEQELNQMSNSAKRGNGISEDIKTRLETYQTILDRYNGGKLTSFRTKLIKFRSLPDDVRQALDAGQIDASKALEIGSVKDDEDRDDLLSWIIDVNPPVKEIRQAKRQQAESKNITKEKKPSPNMKRATTAVDGLSLLLKGDVLRKKNKQVGTILDQITELVAQLQELT